MTQSLLLARANLAFAVVSRPRGPFHPVSLWIADLIVPFFLRELFFCAHDTTGEY